MNYGTRLKMWRMRLHLSQADVSRWLGVKRQSVSAVEMNRVNPEASRVAKLCETLYRDVELRGKQGIPMNAIRKAWSK